MARFPEAPMPERPRGTPEQQVNMLFKALWRLTEQLNSIINTLNKEAKDNGKAGN